MVRRVSSAPRAGIQLARKKQILIFWSGVIAGASLAILAAVSLGGQQPPKKPAMVTLDEAQKQREHLTSRYLNDPANRYTGFDSAAGGVNHIAFLTDDLDATIEFYTQVVRLRLVRVRTDDADPRSTQVFFDMGRGELLAFLRVFNVTEPARTGLGGFHHFGLTVDREQWAAARRRLDKRKIPYTTISHEILDTITLQDPNGIILELSVWKSNPAAGPVPK